MSVRLSCPSCNTAFDLTAVPADRRAACPRCGDVFPVRGEVTETENREQKTEDRSPTLAPAALAPRRPMWLVGLVLAFAGIAVGFAVYSNRGPKPKGEPESPASAATPPMELLGLGYLPPECNVVFAMQPGSLLEYAARTNQEPRELLTRIGLPAPVVGALDSIGLPLAQIDHIAGGLFLPSGPEDFRVALALVLKQPLADEDEFLKKLKAKPLPGGKARYTVELNKVPISPVLARVSPTVWVFGLNAGDLAAVDRGGYGPGGTQFRGSESEGVRKMLAAVPPTAAVWVIADDEQNWAEKPVVKLFGQSPEGKKWPPALNDFRGGTFALNFGEQPRMKVLVRTGERVTADRVRAYFRARAAEVEGATAGGDEAFAQFDAPFDLTLIQRMLADAAQ